MEPPWWKKSQEIDRILMRQEMSKELGQRAQEQWNIFLVYFFQDVLLTWINNSDCN